MLEINLLPVREARKRADVRQQLMHLLLAVITIGGTIAVVHSRLRHDISVANARVSQMQADIAEFKPQLDQVAAFRKKKSALEKKIDVIEGLDRARSGPVRILDELSTRTPERLWLKTVSTKGTTIELKGESLDNELVALFYRALDESPFFDEVDLDGTELASERGGLKFVKFGIRAKLVDVKPDESSAGAAGE